MDGWMTRIRQELPYCKITQVRVCEGNIESVL